MLERQRAQAASDGISWYCRICKTAKSIRNGSFFSKSKLSLQKWMIALLWWTREHPDSNVKGSRDHRGYRM